MKRLIKYLKKDKLYLRLFYYFIGLFIMATIYNTVYVPNNLVVGGTSGLAIIIRELTGLNTTTFINICNIIFISASFLILGKKETIPQLLGSIAYPVMITLTAPLANVINFNFSSFTLTIILAATIYGIANGLIYRAGFSSGGTDILLQIISTKFKIKVTSLGMFINSSIIIAGGIIFSPVQIIYAITIVFIYNKVCNLILFGTSSNKMVYVISKKSREIEDFIMNKINTGATEIKVHSGFFEKKKQMIFCVVHNAQYKKFKHHILKLDPEAFILSNNCYEVKGGIKYSIFPF